MFKDCRLLSKIPLVGIHRRCSIMINQYYSLVLLLLSCITITIMLPLILLLLSITMIILFSACKHGLIYRDK